MRWERTRVWLAFATLALLAGCASRSGPRPDLAGGEGAANAPHVAAPADPAPVLEPVPLGEVASSTPALATGTGAAPEALPPQEVPPVPAVPDVHARLVDEAEHGELNPCHSPRDPDEPLVDSAQRRLYETICGASLWFDGLFGERRNIASAQNTSGRLEISVLNSEYEGTKVRFRGNVRFDFPNLDRRWNAFLGRDDEADFIRDRSEGLALRSQFLDFADENRWLAGLGYSLPGTYKKRTDFRVGGKLGTEPEIFVQGRHRRNYLINANNLFHFRETIFWTNRDGFGSTTSLDYDHVVNRAMLLRWGNIGTVSEATDGLSWRSALLLYHSLGNARALAYEVFLRGETAYEVPLKEWGARTIYRQPLLHRDWLAGELVLGYSWPRFEVEDDRNGSLTVGLGLEILVGEWR
ncbi:MAG: hypothetical protein AB7G12_13930 [Thermoanaerobaculia bacterium]